jgi:hypothetical protein
MVLVYAQSSRLTACLLASSRPARHNGGMDGSIPGVRQQFPPRWAGVGATLPPSLDQLAGPSHGTVELPVDLAWSGDRSFDLENPVDRYLYHMTVLTAAVTAEHYTRWLNAALLASEWERLRLPPPLREAWQQRFPELMAGGTHD